jgi:hypothetical protein
MKKLIELKIKIPVFISKEGRSFVAYCPILDLSSCGKTATEAKSRFANAVALFLNELEEMGTTDQVLEELGWHKQDHPRKEWIPPKVIQHSQLDVRVPVHA